MNKYVKLGDLIKSISKTHKFNKEELIFLNTSDVLEGKILVDTYMPVSEMKGQAKKTIQNGDILYSEIRPKNKRYAYVKNVHNIEDYVVSTKLMVLRNDSELLNTDYLYYFLTSDEAINYLQNRAENRIGSFPQITFEIIQSLNIWLPSLPTQQKIAAVLSALDDKIELNNTINAELEAMAKTLYDYWFVQFEFPNSEGKPYKSSGGAMEYNSILKREIPKGWEDGIFVDIAKLIRGVSYTKDDIKSFESSDDIKILRATNIHGNRIDLNDPVIVPSKFVKEEQLLNPFDILITMSSGSIDHIGKNGFYYFDDKASFGAFCAKVETELLNRFYVYLFMQSKVFTITIKNECLGTNINNLNGSMVNNFKVLKPTDEILIRFNKIIAPIFEKIAINSKQNQELAQLRDWLLPMLMNGQVKVVDAEEQAMSIAAEPNITYAKRSEKNKDDSKEERFRLWLSNEKLAARGDVDEVVLREIFDAMDDEDQ